MLTVHLHINATSGGLLQMFLCVKQASFDGAATKFFSSHQSLLIRWFDERLTSLFPVKSLMVISGTALLFLDVRNTFSFMLPDFTSSLLLLLLSVVLFKTRAVWA